MKLLLTRCSALVLAAAALGLNACTTVDSGGGGGNYNVVARRPNNPAAVRVKVSIRNQAVYVTEGDRVLMAAATCVGTASNPTPKGNFTVTRKEAGKRSYTYGFWVKGDQIIAGTSRKPVPGARYVGYPMAWWVEFKAAYGFHEGYVWPVPRTHGCLRLHKTVAPKFFALTRVGTPVSIQDSQPEDATVGRGLQRPTDYNDPDPPGSFLISARAFQPPAGELLQ
ncbi:MAG: L,D-transpeptidase [Verrucomicrobia bacterium]|nr:L,D-transpeptidase [Verrucomicrobiota bacterium]